MNLELDGFDLPEEWGAGRMGIVTRNEDFLGRCVLVCPEFSDLSQFVMYIADDELTESFWSTEHLPEAVNDLGILWITSNDLEKVAERSIFDIRGTFRKQRQ